MLIELAKATGLHPKRTAFTNGGEFHSACPSCGGTDRFAIWPKTDRYWCRQCKKSGDSIQFCRDFMGMSFHEACLRAGDKTPRLPIVQGCPIPALPPQPWESRGKMFIQGCLKRLLMDSKALDCIGERGISLETIQQYSIGWNPITLFQKREEWGLEKKIENGKEKKLWLPSGIVIPTFQDQALRKIKIRRSDWKEGDAFGKYYILPGSVDCIPVFGDASSPVAVLMEAELDAILVAHEAGALCCCIALGGAQKRPDASLHQWLSQKKLIFFALDFDEAGKKEYLYWHSTYANLCTWPVPVGKSPAEAWKLGVDLKKWILCGVQRMKVGGVSITPDWLSN
jgi:DNA primase